ncbi:hypothetical protein MMUR_05520 [Mycolicibacterium murale]|uniref:Uncharacterized protein n=1 Tax=Mycolicibacterium murale TaxID=182220 RepID=A0A7I9WGK8_9MYCO|nr:hypothetical protein [Mycolicibacterium murale]MCV7182866.1 hypothetical protein [Mycolicibacterium murale]GFG56416.1 hypothetical protein MMUR_05520 [Mycolicibacterium murale]
MIDEYDDEMELAFDEVTKPPRQDYDDEHPEDEPVIRPLCTKCVRDLPAAGSDVCEFCKVVQG